MYRRILVPLDGSNFAEAALSLAVAISRESGATLHLVSVIEPIPSHAFVGWEAAASEWAEGYLTAVCDRVSPEAGGEVTAAVAHGHVVDTLLEETVSHGADVVIMATHGRGVLTRPWLGSVTDGFVRRAETPVILVRPEGGELAEAEPVKEIRTIVVPLDGSELSECALQHAVELGELFGAAYHLTRVVGTPFHVSIPHLAEMEQMNKESIKEERDRGADYLEAHADRLRQRGLRVTAQVRIDPQPGHGVLKEAEEVGCDLIAMATHGRSGLSRVVLGSTADKVLRATPVPLLLYRPTKRSAETSKEPRELHHAR